MDEMMMCKQSFDIDTEIRRQRAIQASDVQFLRESLLAAAERFSDLADLIEKADGYNPVSFMRASAARYRMASGLSQPTQHNGEE